MCFPQYFIGSRQFLPIFGEESYDALERGGLEVGRLEFSRRKAVAGEGGGQRQGETHSCVLVRMRKHKQGETGRDTVVFW